MGSALNDDDDDDICLCIWLTWFDRPTLSHSLDHQASRYAFSVKLTHTFASSFYFFRCFQEFNASVNIYATCETRRGKECFASCITSLLPSSSWWRRMCVWPQVALERYAESHMCSFGELDSRSTLVTHSYVYEEARIVTYLFTLARDVNEVNRRGRAQVLTFSHSWLQLCTSSARFHCTQRDNKRSVVREIKVA